AGHRPARVVREAVPLGEIAGEVQVDPRVVERKAPGAGDQPLAGGEEDERKHRGQREARIVAIRGLSAQGAACSRRSGPAPCPAGGWRAKGRGIHESSSGKPQAPAISRSRAAKKTSGSTAASARSASSRYEVSARREQRVAGVADRRLAQRQPVEEPPVGQLDLDEPAWALGGRTP